MPADLLLEGLIDLFPGFRERSASVLDLFAQGRGGLLHLLGEVLETLIDLQGGWTESRTQKNDIQYITY